MSSSTSSRGLLGVLSGGPITGPDPIRTRGLLGVLNNNVAPAPPIKQGPIAGFGDIPREVQFFGKPSLLLSVGYLELRDNPSHSITFQYFPEELKWSLERANDERAIHGQSWAPNWSVSAGAETLEFELLFNSFFEDRVPNRYSSSCKPGYSTIPMEANVDLYKIWSPEATGTEAVWVLNLAQPAVAAEFLIDSVERTDSLYDTSNLSARRSTWNIKLRRHYEIPDPSIVYRKSKPIPGKGGACVPSAEVEALQKKYDDAQNYISRLEADRNSGGSGEKVTAPEE